MEQRGGRSMASANASLANLQSHHLVVVTKSDVVAWDCTGVQPLLTRTNGAIQAAKKSPRGYDRLAIADDHGLTVYTSSNGKALAHSVPDVQGAIQQLRFSSGDAPAAYDVLYFTSATHNAVQRYSLKERRMLSNGPRHAHQPTAIAVSHNSRLLLSISEGPPSSIYLQNLELSSAPRIVLPQVSTTPAVCADFHPRRPNVFLLGFKDGSLGVYDATRIDIAPHQLHQKPSAKPEIRSFPKLHHVASKTRLVASPAESSLSPSMVAQFLPHNRSQIITGGIDGRCNIVDFEKGTVIRSWHAKGPVTCLSILRTADASATTGGTRKLRKPNSAARHTTTVIAVGRVDGKVLLYDEQGTLMAEKTFDDAAGQIIDVEFVSGKCAPPFDNFGADKCADIANFATGKQPGPVVGQAGSADSQDVRSEECLSGPVQSRFKEHLSRSHMEIGEAVGTVKHVDCGPLAKPQLALPVQRGYMDLFSPIKQSAAVLRSSPPRSRPRITSTTYIASDVARAASQSNQALTSSGKTEISPTDIAPVQISTGRPKTITNPPSTTRPVIRTAQPAIPLLGDTNGQKNQTPSTGVASKRLGSVPTISSGLTVSNKSYRPSPVSSRSSSNSKILADLQRLERLNKSAGVRKIGGNLAIFAPDYQLKHHDIERPLSISTIRSQKSTRRRSARLTMDGGKRASIGRVKVQQPSRARPRPKGINMKAEDIFLTETPLLTPKALRHGFANLDGTVEAESQTSSSVPSHDPEAHIKSTFSSDSSLIESSNSTSHVPNPAHQPAHTAVSAPLLSRAALAGEDTSSSATPVAQRSQTTSTESVTEPTVLRPGFAESYHGPVEVAAYLPRRNSLKFSTPTKKTPRGREPMSEVRMTSARRNGGGQGNGSPVRRDGNGKMLGEQRHRGDCGGCVELRAEVAALKKRQTALEEEVQSLRRLVKGKAACIAT